MNDSMPNPAVPYIPPHLWITLTQIHDHCCPNDPSNIDLESMTPVTIIDDLVHHLVAIHELLMELTVDLNTYLDPTAHSRSN